VRAKYGFGGLLLTEPGHKERLAEAHQKARQDKLKVKFKVRDAKNLALNK